MTPRNIVALSPFWPICRPPNSSALLIMPPGATFQPALTPPRCATAWWSDIYLPLSRKALASVRFPTTMTGSTASPRLGFLLTYSLATSNALSARALFSSLINTRKYQSHLHCLKSLPRSYRWHTFFVSTSNVHWTRSGPVRRSMT